MECKKCKDVDIILSHGCLYFIIILTDQFMFLHVGYGSIIFPKRLLHFTFFSSRFFLMGTIYMQNAAVLLFLYECVSL